MTESTSERGMLQKREFIIRDATVLTMNDERDAYECGFIWVRGEQILRVGDVSDLGDVPADVEVTSARGRLILPGLVNAHGHLSNGILRGIYDEMPLGVWFAKGMWPVLNAMDEKTAMTSADLALLELMTTGVTTTVSAEFGTPRLDMPDSVLKAVTKSRVRALVSRMTVDSPDESDPSQTVPPEYREPVAQAIAETERLQREYQSERVRVAPEALGVLRCTEEMVAGLHDLAVRSDSAFLMHIASSKDEHLSSQRLFGHGSVTELQRRGALSARTLLAHAIWLDDTEIHAIAEADAGVSHNPVANAYYASGIARLSDLLAAGVRVGLGVDGASTNNSQNLWESMKMALLFQKERTEDASFGSAELALELATRGGAAALHMEDRIGSLEPGKQADFISIDVRRTALAPRQTLVSNLVYSNDPQAVRDVYIAGEPVVIDGIHQFLDHDTVLTAADEALEHVLVQSGLKSYLESRSSWRWIRTH